MCSILVTKVVFGGKDGGSLPSAWRMEQSNLKLWSIMIPAELWKGRVQICEQNHGRDSVILNGPCQMQL